MKIPWEKKHKTWGITAFLIIAAAIVFFVALDKWGQVWNIVKIVVKSLEPIIYGLIMAYLLNPLMSFIERKAMFPLFKRAFKKNTDRAKGVARISSILLAWVVAIAAILALMALIIPELYKSIESLISKIPEYSAHIGEFANKILKNNPDIETYLQSFTNNLSTDFTEVMTNVKDWLPSVNIIVDQLTKSLTAFVSVLFNTFVGIIVSVYVLKDKEKFVAQCKRIFYSTMSYKKANGVISFCRLTHEKFGSFIIGKIIDSMIIGVMCYTILLITGMPYAALVSVIVGVTNVIPFFGPFMGAIPSAILILMVDPVKALLFVVIIFLLQQFDGNVLGPKILGNTTGISSFWVMFSILVGSALFGAWGLICSVPMFAVVYTLVKDGCHVALRKKGIDYSSETFEKIDHIDEDTKAPIWLDK